MTITNLFNDHARRVAQVTYWHTLGWISDEERIRYEVYDTEITQNLYDQMVEETNY